MIDQTQEFNLTAGMYHWARIKPRATAICLDEGLKLTYADLVSQVGQVRLRLRDHRLQAGQKVLLFFPISLELIILFLALVAEGIVPVLLDPRLSAKHWKKALNGADISAIFSVKKFFRLRWVWWRLFKTQMFSMNSKGRGVIDANTIFSFSQMAQIADLPTHRCRDEDTALISLTSGTTGEPKIIVRHFGILKHQTFYSMKYLPALDLDRHLPLYGVSILLSIFQGAETLVPEDMATEELVAQIELQQVTRLSGPPGAIFRIAKHYEDISTINESVRSILIGGAPISKSVCRKLKRRFANAKITIIYGCTECEPIAAGDADRFLELKGSGYFVGKNINELKIHQMDPFEFEHLRIFEVGLEGANVSATRDDRIHHTGDLAYYDSEGALWLVGRKKEMIESIPLGFPESEVEALSPIKRCALVEHDGRILCCIEKMSNDGLIDLSAIDGILSRYFKSKIPIHQVEKIPVDARHEWKCEREKLRKQLISEKIF